MVKDTEISSTERLLKVIRSSKGKPSSEPVQTSSPTRPGPKLKNRLPGFKKYVNVGVDIGYTALRMVKMSPEDDKWKLGDYRSVPLDPSVPRESEQFVNFLGNNLREFCDGPVPIRLWCLMSSVNVEVWHIRIPKMAKKQVPNAVFWTMRKEKGISGDETVFDFEVQDEVLEKGVPKISVMVYTAPRREVLAMKSMFARAGFPLTGISIAPFAIQNMFRTGWVPTFADTVANLFIGRDWARIDVFSQGNMVFTRGIKTGTNALIESLTEFYNEQQKKKALEPEIRIEPEPDEDAEVTLDLEDGQMYLETDSGTKPLDTGVSRLGDRPITVEQGRKIFLSRISESEELAEDDPGCGLSDDEIFEMLLPAVERLVRQIERTFEHSVSNLGNEPAGKIFISGPLSAYEKLIRHLGRELGLETGLMDPLDPDLPMMAEVAPPATLHERLDYETTVGMALSDNDYTPNFLFTHKEKQVKRRHSIINTVTAAVMAVILVFAAGAWVRLEWKAGQNKDRVAALERKVRELSPVVDQALLLQTMARVKRHQELLGELSRKYVTSVLMGELSALTPENIELLSVTAELGPAGKPPADKTGGAKEQVAKSVIVDGVIQGDRQMFDSYLLAYLVRLDNSPLFASPRVGQSDIEAWVGGDEVLHFKIIIELI